MKEYNYPEAADEISGFGGGYEQTCRNMVIAGMKWFDENPSANVSYKTFENVYGITTDENEDCKRLQDAMVKASGNDCTGAMMQATLGHVMFAHTNGWDKYIEKMSEKEKDK